MRSASNSISVGEMLARDALEIAGVVVRRERVLLAADGGKLLREAAGRIFRRALEHQVFEEMRDAGLAGRLVGSADPVPQHVGDDRRAAIRDHHHGQAVGERELRDRRRGERSVAQHGRSESGNDGKGSGRANQDMGHGMCFQRPVPSTADRSLRGKAADRHIVSDRTVEDASEFSSRRPCRRPTP